VPPVLGRVLGEKFIIPESPTFIGGGEERSTFICDNSQACNVGRMIRTEKRIALKG
jgi:hypothetical protein